MKFPDPESASPDGLLAMGGDLKTETLEEAYSIGVFPWPQQGYPLIWFSPPKRGVLFFSDFKIPKSTQKALSRKQFVLTINKAFKDVIENCARIPRNSETGTWILPEMVDAYLRLHQQKKALSVEAWRDGKLVGGLYGVLINSVFSGESMFFKESEASKVCLVHLVEHLKPMGLEWIDIQMVTPLLKQFGGEYIARKEFLKMLKAARKKI